MKNHEVLDLIQEITRNDGTTYMEIGNMVMNGRAELAAERGFIKQVRILQLNIPHSTHVEKYQDYINKNFEIPDESMDHWDEWTKTPDMQAEVYLILKENHIG
ncbi:hypothetical protein ACFQH1_04545 [Lactiplantibacillus daoliensis]|uniref:Uncharacterized protein n=1 Tax=Lactiplantibacillus daoliensis TaxID=2559916 RepID=A0ABW1UGW8_9LACO|nr:hypothetical protein [Lactiplantibacillus daoliensis]